MIWHRLWRCLFSGSATDSVSRPNPFREFFPNGFRLSWKQRIRDHSETRIRWRSLLRERDPPLRVGAAGVVAAELDSLGQWKLC
jgi:hypothetical protein